jgi:hypothetical protein
LIDDEGYIRYDHIGEGAYAETEKVIQSLLTERAAAAGQNVTINGSISRPENAQSVDFYRINTPELYFGYSFARAQLGNPEGFKPDQVVKYTIPEGELKPNAIYLEGEWKNHADSMELQSEVGHIVLIYSAKAVNIVAGGSGELHVTEDESAQEEGSRGQDVSEQGTVVIDGQKLYNLAAHQHYGEHRLQIDAIGKGFRVYTFTFG